MDSPAWDNLPAVLRDFIAPFAPESELWEIRLRTGGRVQLIGRTENRLCGDALTERKFRQLLSALMEHSLYAWEDELSHGFFTARHGFRVGVGGRYRKVDGVWRLPDVYSACIRIARPVIGCAEGLTEWLAGRSCLVISPPGCGKTTLLRDMARLLSERGENIAILDERSEIAAAWHGQPSMPVGDRTDIVEQIGKPEGLPMIVRALSPQVIVTDELGGEADAAAVMDALRSGVRVIASAHAADMEGVRLRRPLGQLLREGFDMIVELGRPAGTIRAVRIFADGQWLRVDSGKGGEQM